MSVRSYGLAAKRAILEAILEHFRRLPRLSAGSHVVMSFSGVVVLGTPSTAKTVSATRTRPPVDWVRSGAIRQNSLSGPVGEGTVAWWVVGKVSNRTISRL